MSENYAEDVNYYKTSRSGTEAWMERIESEIEKAGGKILQNAFGKDSITKQAAFMVEFELTSGVYKAIWPVLPTYGYSSPKDKRLAEKAAVIQAVTALFRDIKNSCVKAKFLGERQAFFDYALLPDGRTTIQASLPELMDAVPRMLNLASSSYQIDSGEEDVIDGDFEEVDD